MPAVDKEGDDLIYKHVYSHGHGHHGLQEVSIQLIDKVDFATIDHYYNYISLNLARF